MNRLFTLVLPRALGSIEKEGLRYCGENLNKKDEQDGVFYEINSSSTTLPSFIKPNCASSKAGGDYITNSSACTEQLGNIIECSGLFDDAFSTNNFVGSVETVTTNEPAVTSDISSLHVNNESSLPDNNFSGFTSSKNNVASTRKSFINNFEDNDVEMVDDGGFGSQSLHACLRQVPDEAKKDTDDVRKNPDNQNKVITFTMPGSSRQDIKSKLSQVLIQALQPHSGPRKVEISIETSNNSISPSSSPKPNHILNYKALLANQPNDLSTSVVHNNIDLLGDYSIDDLNSTSENVLNHNPTPSADLYTASSVLDTPIFPEDFSSLMATNDIEDYLFDTTAPPFPSVNNNIEHVIKSGEDNCYINSRTYTPENSNQTVLNKQKTYKQPALSQVSHATVNSMQQNRSANSKRNIIDTHFYKDYEPLNVKDSLSSHSNYYIGQQEEEIKAAHRVLNDHTYTTKPKNIRPRMRFQAEQDRKPNSQLLYYMLTTRENIVPMNGSDYYVGQQKNLSKVEKNPARNKTAGNSAIAASSSKRAVVKELLSEKNCRNGNVSRNGLRTSEGGNISDARKSSRVVYPPSKQYSGGVKVNSVANLHTKSRVGARSHTFRDDCKSQPGDEDIYISSEEEDA